MRDTDGGDFDPPIVENMAAPDIFATGIEWTFHADFVRITFWSEHPLGFGANSLEPVERHVVANVVMPTASFERAAAKWETIKLARERRRLRSN
jgi:hypothetical protein